MMKEFESRLATARKLSALANPANGGLPGELDNARRMLAAHLEKHGITPAMLAEANRKLRELECIPLGKEVKPVLNKELVMLAKQCLTFVTGENREMRFWKEDYFTPQKGMKPDKCWRIYMADSEVTDLEHEEWRACFQHYAADFIATQAELKLRVKQAQAACKLALQGFVNKHDIFAPSSGKSNQQLSPDELAALMAAYSAARGSSWVKPAGKIDGRKLLS